MKKEIDTISRQFSQRLANIRTLAELRDIKIAYLGRKGQINNLLSRLPELRANQKKKFGPLVNRLKSDIADQIGRKHKFLAELSEETESVDVTLPGKRKPLGSLHLVSYAIEEISRIFERIGFIRMSYREVEWEYFSFEALNMPQGHPARDDFETFFIDSPDHKTYGRMLLTPHTSSGQIREMLRVGTPPIKMINIAKTYRPNWDASHVPMFHQFEGLCIDKHINITHLKGTIEYFMKAYFGEERSIRLRPFHLEFTEPSFEVDIACDFCSGTGKVTPGVTKSVTTINKLKKPISEEKCKLCKSGWLELGGAGMVHPNVLTAGE
ncbi:MAG: phenylalanine--tRNA ligase subunit alpha, partial [Candidatus Paceibacterota bacterium]